MLKNTKYFKILCFVDRASGYIRVMKTNMMQYLSSVYFANQPLRVSGIFVLVLSQPGQQTVN